MALYNSQMSLKLKEERKKYRQLSQEFEILIAERTAELEAFIYSVSHDLRAPLRHIKGFSQILLNKCNVMPDDARMYLEKINESTNNMNSLINRLLNLSKVGQQELNIRSVELNNIINEAMQELELDLLDRDITWNIGKLPEVECDPDLIRIVVDNLLLNAVKFTGNNDHAVIIIDPLPDGNPGFMIKDNGVGFDMKNYEKLFGVFQRLHTKDEFKGTGVGLATVHRIMTRQKGRIWARAQVNQGATFYIELPVLEKNNKGI
jgi:chemotaxis family two-component system sensor kinase Cph1